MADLQEPTICPLHRNHHAMSLWLDLSSPGVENV
jgi:hypothetical protein